MRPNAVKCGFGISRLCFKGITFIFHHLSPDVLLWVRHFQVVMVETSGRQVPGCYGSQVKSGDQSLSKPLSLCDAGENHILVTDYRHHRIHLVTHQLHFVRHLVAKGHVSNNSVASCGCDDRGITFPRQICLDGGVLYVGTDSGHIGIYRVQ